MNPVTQHDLRALVHVVVEIYRGHFIADCQRVLVGRAMILGTTSMREVRERVRGSAAGLRDATDAVVGPLVARKVIRRAAVEGAAGRPTPTTRWEIDDRDAAAAWLWGTPRAAGGPGSPTDPQE